MKLTKISSTQNYGFDRRIYEPMVAGLAGDLCSVLREKFCQITVIYLRDVPQRFARYKRALHLVSRRVNCEKHAIFRVFDLLVICNKAICHGHLQKLLKVHHIMIPNPAQISRQHLANIREPVYSLIRKVCACGKASTAKQLAQYEVCVICWRARTQPQK